MHPLKYTDEFLGKARAKADSNLAWFMMNILGNELPTKDHARLCNVLQGIDQDVGPWRRLMVCWARGQIKTTIVCGWILWKGLTTPNWSALMVSMRAENVKTHLREKIASYFLDYHFARPMMEAVYPERIPPGQFWTAEEFSLVLTRPDSPPLLRVAGLDTKLESKHVDCVIPEDPEGADAETSEIPNREAQNFVFNRAVPLLKDPSVGQILLVCTPHGSDSTAYKVRDSEANGSLDNSQRQYWKISWQPVFKEDGTPVWPERYGQKWWDEISRFAETNEDTRRMLLTQYLLERPTGGFSDFDPTIIDKCNYQLLSGLVLRYPATEFRLDSRTGALASFQRIKTCPLRECRFFLHGDPKHREKVNRRSEWAWIVVAVSPDCHKFVIDCWMADASLEEGAERFLSFYRRFVPHRWTFDTTGAQIWFKTILTQLERTKYRNIVSLGNQWDRRVRRIPYPSRKMVEAYTLEKKEGRIYSRLSPQFEFSWLHLNQKQPQQQVLRQQLLRIGTDSKDPIDGADALAQGAGDDPETGRPVWTPPPSPEAIKNMRLQTALLEMTRTGRIPRAALGLEPDPQPLITGVI